MVSFSEVHIGDTVYKVMSHHIDAPVLLEGKVVDKTGTRLIFGERHFPSLKMTRGGGSFYTVGRIVDDELLFVIDRAEANTWLLQETNHMLIKARERVKVLEAALQAAQKAVS